VRADCREGGRGTLRFCADDGRGAESDDGVKTKKPVLERPVLGIVVEGY